MGRRVNLALRRIQLRRRPIPTHKAKRPNDETKSPLSGSPGPNTGNKSGIQEDEAAAKAGRPKPTPQAPRRLYRGSTIRDFNAFHFWPRNRPPTPPHPPHPAILSQARNFSAFSNLMWATSKTDIQCEPTKGLGETAADSNAQMQHLAQTNDRVRRSRRQT